MEAFERQVRCFALEFGASHEAAVPLQPNQLPDEPAVADLQLLRSPLDKLRFVGRRVRATPMRLR